MAAAYIRANGPITYTYDVAPWNWTTVQATPTTVTMSATTNNIVWRQWYDVQTMSTTITGGLQGHRYTYTVSDEDLWHNYQQPIWDHWERVMVRERETEAEFRAAQAEVERRHQEYRDQQQRTAEERNRRWLAEQERIAGAQQRALGLLEMILTPEERLYRAQHGEIMVRGSDGGMYVIEERGSVHGNVRQTDEHGCLLGRICIAPDMFDREERKALPLADGWVGQYLAIKYQEETFRATGNFSSVRPCQHADVPTLRGRDTRVPIDQILGVA